MVINIKIIKIYTLLFTATLCIFIFAACKNAAKDNTGTPRPAWSPTAGLSQSILPTKAAGTPENTTSIVTYAPINTSCLCATIPPNWTEAPLVTIEPPPTGAYDRIPIPPGISANLADLIRYVKYEYIINHNSWPYEEFMHFITYGNVDGCPHMELVEVIPDEIFILTSKGGEYGLSEKAIAAIKSGLTRWKELDIVSARAALSKVKVIDRWDIGSTDADGLAVVTGVTNGYFGPNTLTVNEYLFNGDCPVAYLKAMGAIMAEYRAMCVYQVNRYGTVELPDKFDDHAHIDKLKWMLDLINNKIDPGKYALEPYDEKQFLNDFFTPIMEYAVAHP